MLSSDHAFPQWNLRDFSSLSSVVQLPTCGGALPSAVPGHRCTPQQLLPATLWPADAAAWGTRVTSSAHLDQAVSQPPPVGSLPKQPRLWNSWSRAGWALMLWRSPQINYQKESEMRTRPCCLLWRPFSSWHSPHNNKQNKWISIYTKQPNRRRFSTALLNSLHIK